MVIEISINEHALSLERFRDVANAKIITAQVLQGNVPATLIKAVVVRKEKK